jgi:hypothetical protein
MKNWDANKNPQKLNHTIVNHVHPFSWCIRMGVCQHVHTYIPVTEAGSRSLVLCNTKVPESTTMSPQSTDTILLAL